MVRVVGRPPVIMTAVRVRLVGGHDDEESLMTDNNDFPTETVLSDGSVYRVVPVEVGVRAIRAWLSIRGL